MTNENTVAAELSKVLADSYNLMLKTHNYHWNVEGPHFPALHALFETHYTELFTAVDEIAERIRALGAKAPASYAEFAKLSPIKDGDSRLEAKAMVADLLADHETLVAHAEKALEIADDADDVATEDLLTQRIQSHQKHCWMMRSFLK